VQHDADEPLARSAAFALGHDGVAAAKGALVELDREADAGRVGRRLRRKVRRPGAVALLEPQRVDGAVAAGDEAVRLARLAQRVHDAAERARDCVRAHALQEGRGARAADLELREARLVEETSRLARRVRLDADRGTPVLAGPPAWPQRLVAACRIRLVPVDAL